MIKSNKYDCCGAILITAIAMMLLHLQLDPQRIANIISFGFYWHLPLLLLMSFMILAWQILMIYRCQTNYTEISVLIKIRNLTLHQRIRAAIKLDLINIILAELPLVLILLKCFSLAGFWLNILNLLVISVSVALLHFASRITIIQVSVLLIVLRITLTLICGQ